MTIKLTAILATGLAALLLAGPVQAQNFCVFDPLGAQGDFYAMAKDYRVAAKRWGVDLVLKPYNDESIAVEDFKAGQCDLINMTGLRARQFNQFTGTIDSVGGIENYAQFHEVLNLMTSPKVAKYMSSGDYEVDGIFPIGAGYPFVNDRSITSLGKAAGKKVAVMDWDKTQAMLVELIGAQPVASDITNYGAKFNNGAVDIIIAPIVLYKPFELYRGLRHNGGIVRRAVIELSMQIVARRGRFPEDFGRNSREYTAGQVDRAFGTIHEMENQVDPHHWLYATTTSRDDYYKLMRDARMHLARDGFFDHRMLGILKRVRCKSDPGSAECALADE